MGNDVRILGFFGMSSRTPRRVSCQPFTRATRILTLQLSVELGYPVDLDRKSLKGKAPQRSMTSVAQEGTYCHWPFACVLLYLTFVIEFNTEAASSRSHWHGIGWPLAWKKWGSGVHNVDNIHRCHRSALDIVTHVHAKVSTYKPDLQEDMINGGRT
jgi:hypothetical protein